MRRTKETASQIASLVDWLADVIRGDIVLTATQFVQGNYDYVYCKIHFSGAVRLMIASIRLMGQLKSTRSIIDATQR